VVEWAELAPTSLSLPAELATDIERLILAGELPPGAKLPPERELATTLGVSRASIRDALRDLEMRGLLERTPGRGTIVVDRPSSGMGRALLRELDPRTRDLLEVMEIRAIIEPPMTARAALRATARDLAHLQGLVEAMSPDLDPEGYAALDRGFHQAIAQCTHNQLLAGVLDAVNPLTALSRSGGLQTDERRVASISGHRRILEALRAHDPERASSAAAEHVTSVQQYVLRASEADGRRGVPGGMPGGDGDDARRVRGRG
jgi:GntR family transcriptional repressor for pyruvate dehydrogenase complex